MNKKEFLENLQDILQRKDKVTPEMKLEDIKEWDSLALLTVSAFFQSEFNIILNLDEVRNFVTVDDLIKKAGIDE